MSSFTWILSPCVFAFGSSFLSDCKFSTEGKRCDLHTAQEQECGVHFAACACSLVQCSIVQCVVFQVKRCSVVHCSMQNSVFRVKIQLRTAESEKCGD